jgi:fibronectin-binding autotransporter adhesin
MSITGVPALVILSGVTQQIPAGDYLEVGTGIDTRSSSTLFIAPGGVGSYATSVQIGSSTVSVSLAGNTTVSGSNTFTTGSGTVTINGATVFSGVGVTATGSGNFDFSGSSGTFLTSTGANTLSGSTTLASGKNFTAAGGASALDFSAASGAFNTSTGAVALNGSTTLAANKNFTAASGTSALDFSAASGAFNTSTGAVSVNGNTTFTGSTTVTVNAFSTAGVVHNSSAGLLSSSLIVNADVSATAAIAYSKLNLGNSIVNSDVNTAAAISVSKLAGGSTAQVLITNGSTPTWTTLLGDATVSASGVVTVGSAAGNFEVTGNLTVGGTETIIGTSVFQSAVTFDGDVTIADGYTLTTDSILSAGSDVLNINGAGGIDLQKNGTTYLDIGVTTNNVMYVPDGVTLEASGTGQIIATSSSGTEEITITGVNTLAVGAAGDAVYVSGNSAVSSAEANSLTTGYVVGFAKDKSATGNLYTDGLVTPNVTGSAAFGNVMYLDPANPGKVTATAPAAAGQVVSPVGFMLNGTQMIVRILTPVQL